RQHEAQRQRRQEADAPAIHREHDDVAADHREAAMGEVHEAHEAHRDRQADRDDEQHHAGGHSTEKDAGDVDAEDHGETTGQETGTERPPPAVAERRPGPKAARLSVFYLGAQGPIFSSLQASLTASILPIVFWKRRPSFITTSERYSFMTMSRVAG